MTSGSGSSKILRQQQTPNNKQRTTTQGVAIPGSLEITRILTISKIRGDPPGRADPVFFLQDFNIIMYDFFREKLEFLENFRKSQIFMTLCLSVFSL